MSDKLPVRGAHHRLSSVRTSLHKDTDIVTYLSYTDVPWWLSVRKEVFSPRERLTNTKTIDLIFFQIVRDMIQYPCVRIPKQGREEMHKLLGKEDTPDHFHTVELTT